MSDIEIGFPDETSSDEMELLMRWLRYLRGAVARKASGVSDVAAHWRPDGCLISLIGIVSHLTNVEWRWIDGVLLGHEVSRSAAEFEPGPELQIDVALDRYRARQAKTDRIVSSVASLTTACRGWDGEGKDLPRILLHLINETARHAGHADAVRELVDGLTGE